MPDFTPISYIQLIRQAKKSNFVFMSFDEGLKHRNSKKKICLLRHDIDADLEAALKMARIENRYGIKSTYFLMLRSTVYNLFSPFNHRFVNKIIELGHHIGLHYDGSFLPNTNKTLNEWVEMEANIVEQMFAVKISVVSFHQPNEKVLKNKIKIKGFINTYDKEDMQTFHYLSDSNKVWKEYHPLKVFEENIYTKFQILIHPLWWMQCNQNLSTEKIWDMTLLNNWRKTQEYLYKTEGAYGKERRLKIWKHE